MNRRLRRTSGRIDSDMKVLVVEDEPLLASTLSIGLRAEGFVVVEALPELTPALVAGVCA